MKPTVGRIVWYEPFGSDHMTKLDDQPLAATVFYVHDDRHVSIDIIDHAGVHYPRANVELLQGDEDQPIARGNYAYWMPYQVGQAKAQEAKAQEAKPPLSSVA